MERMCVLLKYLVQAYAGSGGKQYPYNKPNFCPHCGLAVDAATEFKNIGNYYYAAFYTCTYSECRKMFFCAYLLRGDRMDLLFMYPREPPAGIAPEIRALSARFVDLYAQSFDAEQSGNFDLAACGYRNAVEALVKDYAITHKGVAADENLTQKTLQGCIMDYLDGLDAAIAAFMVKELGNAATHYPQCGEPFDFVEQKVYLELFLQYITGKLKILNVKANLPSKHLQRFEKREQAAPALGEDAQ